MPLILEGLKYKDLDLKLSAWGLLEHYEFATLNDLIESAHVKHKSFISYVFLMKYLGEHRKQFEHFDKYLELIDKFINVLEDYSLDIFIRITLSGAI